MRPCLPGNGPLGGHGPQFGNHCPSKCNRNVSIKFCLMQSGPPPPGADLGILRGGVWGGGGLGPRSAGFSYTDKQKPRGGGGG